jgi:hypothetical protein
LNSPLLSVYSLFDERLATCRRAKRDNTSIVDAIKNSAAFYTKQSASRVYMLDPENPIIIIAHMPHPFDYSGDDPDLKAIEDALRDKVNGAEKIYDISSHLIVDRKGRSLVMKYTADQIYDSVDRLAKLDAQKGKIDVPAVNVSTESYSSSFFSEDGPYVKNILRINNAAYHQSSAGLWLPSLCPEEDLEQAGKPLTYNVVVAGHDIRDFSFPEDSEGGDILVGFNAAGKVSYLGLRPEEAKVVEQPSSTVPDDFELEVREPLLSETNPKGAAPMTIDEWTTAYKAEYGSSSLNPATEQEEPIISSGRITPPKPPRRHNSNRRATISRRKTRRHSRSRRK